VPGLCRSCTSIGLWSDGNGLCMQYPVTATQWHPEKNVFEWATHLHVPHSYEAVSHGSISFDAKNVANLYAVSACISYSESTRHDGQPAV